MATKKRSTIGNIFVRNKQMSITHNNNNISDNNNIPRNQQCNGRGCRQCPLSNTATRLIINGVPLRIPSYLDCKSRHVIYMWICKLCKEKVEAYFGRTTQEAHVRSNGHRGCFNDEKWLKSALSIHPFIQTKNYTPTTPQGAHILHGTFWAGQTWSPPRRSPTTLATNNYVHQRRPPTDMLFRYY